ncbi:hypothetical protein PQX77_015794 [Marasmius sp. AFHP31]|nr:hypothetical protein PQX77_015794 [Marasmius sp. AFHP31]
MAEDEAIGLEEDEMVIEEHQEAREGEEGRDGEDSNVSTQETVYATPTSSPSASFTQAEGRRTLLQGRLGTVREDVSSLGPTDSSVSSTSASFTSSHATPFFPLANLAFHHPITSSSTPASF